MSEMLVVYITCPSLDDAKNIAKHLMSKRLCACVNIYPEMQPMFFWPPKSGKIDESKEVVLLVKTIESKYAQVEEEAAKVHPDDTPCIFAIPVKHVSKKYYDWLVGEME